MAVLWQRKTPHHLLDWKKANSLWNLSMLATAQQPCHVCYIIITFSFQNLPSGQSFLLPEPLACWPGLLQPSFIMETGDSTSQEKYTPQASFWSWELDPHFLSTLFSFLSSLPLSLPFSPLPLSLCLRSTSYLPQEQHLMLPSTCPACLRYFDYSLTLSDFLLPILS